jgi:hypothetical protein
VTDRVRDRVSRRGGVGGPCLHQFGPLREQVAAAVCSLGLTLDGMGESHFDHFGGKVGFLGGPVAEARTEAVRRASVAVVAESVAGAQKAVLRQRLACARVRKDEFAVGRQGAGGLKELHAAIGERDDVFAAGFHAAAGLVVRSGDSPCAGIGVDLVAPRFADLRRSRGRQYEKFEGELGDRLGVAGSKFVNEIRDLRVGQGGMVLLVVLMPWQAISYEFDRIVARAVTGEFRPVENGRQALLHAASGFGFLGPDRREHVEDFGRGNFVDRLGADDGEGVGGERVDPLIHMLAVAPGAPPLLVDLFRGFFKGGNRDGAPFLARAAFVLGWVDAAICLGAVLGSHFTCSGQGDLVERAEAEIAPPAIDGEAHGPALAPTRVNLKIEASTVGVPTGNGGVGDGQGREPMDALRVAFGQGGCRDSKQDSQFLPHKNPHGKGVIGWGWTCREAVVARRTRCKINVVFQRDGRHACGGLKCYVAP